MLKIFLRFAEKNPSKKRERAIKRDLRETELTVKLSKRGKMSTPTFIHNEVRRISSHLKKKKVSLCFQTRFTVHTIKRMKIERERMEKKEKEREREMKTISTFRQI